MGDKSSTVRLFEEKQVRAVWDEDNGKWWFSVLDVISVLTSQPDYQKTRNYWKWLKKKLTDEGSELVSGTTQLKMAAADGKSYKTDAADTEQVLRLIQSVPSKKAEPFKLWLAKVGSERIDESVDPELSIDRAIQNYRRLGYSESWINQRLKSIDARKALTDEWDKSGVHGKEYASLTDLMSRTWSGMDTREYKKFKGLKKENLRDNMTNTELVLNMLAEVSATDISIARQPEGFRESAAVAVEGATVAKVAREQLEQSTGRPAISSLNVKMLQPQPDLLDAGPFYHGTKADLKPGDFLEPNFSSNYGKRKKANFVYFSATLDAAVWGAELAAGDAPGRIYVVEPTGSFEDDPNLTDKMFPGNPTRSYRTRQPLKVTGEVAGWKGHTQEELRNMLDHLESLKAQGVEAIND